MIRARTATVPLLAVAMMLCASLTAAQEELERTPVRSPGSAPAPGTDPGYRISGTMVDSLDGHPLSHALVTISPAGASSPDISVLSGEDGKFVFEHLAAGKYRLSAERRGYAALQYKQHESFTSAIVAGPNLDSGHIRFALPPGAAISGVVTDEANEAVRDAAVQLYRQGVREGKMQNLAHNRVNTDDEGRYRFAELEPGTYLIAVDAHPWYADSDVRQGFSDGAVLGALQGLAGTMAFRAVPSDDPALDVVYQETFFANATALDAASPIRLSSVELAIADVALHPIPALHLRVHTSGDRSAVFVRSAAHGHSQPQSVSSQIAEIGGLPPGPLTVFVMEPGEGEQAAPNKIRSQSLVLSADAEVQADTFHQGVHVSGVVKTYDHSALPQPLTIFLHSSQPGEAGGALPADPTGQFRLAGPGAPVGTYKVLLQPGPVIVGMSVAGATLEGENIVLGAEPEVRLTLTIATGAAHVSGVALKDGQPVEGVMLLLVPQDFGRNPALYRRDQSDSDGTFEFQNVVQGHYVAVAIEDGWQLEWSKPEVLEKYLARGEKVLVGRDAVEDLKLVVQ